MANWKLANGAHANSYRAACLDYCIAHGIPWNFMGFCATTNFRVALLNSASNIGPSARLMSSVTGVLGSIPVTSDASTWTSFAGTGGAHWEVLYQTGLNPGDGEVAAYRLLSSSADVKVLDVTGDETFRSNIYAGNVVRYGTGFYFPFANEGVPLPWSVENVNITNESIPDGSTQWRFRAFGAGGGGGGGLSSSSSGSRYGGSGGGGGAMIDTGWQSVALLGPTFSVTRGLGGVGGQTPAGAGDGNDGTWGGDSVFTSGDVSLSAGGGEGGGGATSTTHYAGGIGGVRTVSGLTGVTGADGTQGGSSNNTATPNNTAGGGAGGGGGGAVGTSFSSGRKGGDTTTGTGGSGGTGTTQPSSGPNQAAGLPGPGGGGAQAGYLADGSSFHAGKGGLYGGGGGGAGAKTGSPSGVANFAGDGGDGYVLVEWA
jgi:hypothetical protein